MASTTPTRIQILRTEYRAAKRALSAATKAKTWHALARMRNQVLEIHAELVQAEKAAQEEAADNMTAEEFEAQLIESLRAMPRDLAQRLMDEAHPPPGLRVVEG